MTIRRRGGTALLATAVQAILGCSTPQPAPTVPRVGCPEPIAGVASAPSDRGRPVPDGDATAGAAPPPSPTPTPTPEPEPTEAFPSGPVVVADFDASPFADDDARAAAYARIEGAQLYEPMPASSAECADYRAFVVEDTGDGAPRAPGLPAIGALVLGTLSGQTRAVFAPREHGARWWIVACADLAGDKRPELVVTDFGVTLVLGLGPRPETLYEGASPLPERDPDGRVVLHVRDGRLRRIGLGMPAVFVPALPTYWRFEGTRFVDRTAKEQGRMQWQREQALAAAARCAQADAFCDERLAAFFAGTAVLMGDADKAAAKLPTEPQRKRFRELVTSLTKGARP